MDLLHSSGVSAVCEQELDHLLPVLQLPRREGERERTLRPDIVVWPYLSAVQDTLHFVNVVAGKREQERWTWCCDRVYG